MRDILKFKDVLKEAELEDLYSLARELKNICKKRNYTVSVSESMTGGLLSAVLTEIPGSSVYFWGGLVSYNPRIKNLLSGVSPKSLKEHGAVSEKVTIEMSEGIRKLVKSTASVAITGVAGPGPGTGINKGLPGTVFISVSTEEKTRVKQFKFEGEREEVRIEAVKAAIRFLNITLMEIGG